MIVLTEPSTGKKLSRSDSPITRADLVAVGLLPPAIRRLTSWVDARPGRKNQSCFHLDSDNRLLGLTLGLLTTFTN